MLLVVFELVCFVVVVSCLVYVCWLLCYRLCVFQSLCLLLICVVLFVCLFPLLVYYLVCC